MEINNFRGITCKKKPEKDYTYLFKSGKDYGIWNYKKKGDKKHGRK